MKTLHCTSLLRTSILGLAISFASAASASVFINEIHYDNDGIDAGEFIEVAGPAGTDLTGYSLVLYNGAIGANPQNYDTVELAGTIGNQQNGFGTLHFPAPGLQNGPSDGIALFDGTTVLQFLSYEGTVTATEGPANGMTSTNIGVSEPGSDPIGLSLQLQGTGTMYDDFTWAGPIAQTPGFVNAPGQTFGVAEPQTLVLLLAGLGLLGFGARRRGLARHA